MKKILTFMNHYTIKRDDLSNLDADYKELKKKYDKLIKKNQHHNLTLTYDFENLTAGKRNYSYV